MWRVLRRDAEAGRPAAAAALRGVLRASPESAQGFALLSLAACTLLGACALGWLLFRLALLSRSVTACEFNRQWGCSRKRPKPAFVTQPFHFGVCGNFAKVFGRHPLLWLLPTNQGMEGNGIFFEVEPHADAVAGRSPWTPGAVDA